MASSTESDLALAKLVLFCDFFTQGIPILTYVVFAILKLREKNKLPILTLVMLITYGDIFQLVAQSLFVTALNYKVEGSSLADRFFDARGFVLGLSLLCTNIAYSFFSLKYWASSLRIRAATCQEPISQHDKLIRGIFWAVTSYVVVLTVLFVWFEYTYAGWEVTALEYVFSLLYCSVFIYFCFMLDGFCRMKLISESLGTQIDSKNVAYLLISYGGMSVSGILFTIQTYVIPSDAEAETSIVIISSICSCAAQLCLLVILSYFIERIEGYKAEHLTQDFEEGN